MSSNGGGSADVAIRCENLWKRYRRRDGKYRTLRDDLAGLVKRRVHRAEPERQWALRELTLSVGRGEALGIIGPNGSGKSTLLKLLAGVTYPTRGRIEVRGLTGAFIELSSGMHPELTGRENIYLYGAIIGLGRREVQRKYDAIVEFSELAPHLEMPVKRYSAGMKIRLGFSIAAHVDPDILLVDEVLAVGDAAFQRKCLERISAMLSSDVTIVYVSHELGSLERLCPRALWLDDGSVRGLDASATIVRSYLKEVETKMAARTFRGAGREGFRLEGVTLSGSDGGTRAHFATGEPLTISLSYECPPDTTPAQVAIKLLDDRMTTIALATWDAPAGERPPRRAVLRCTFSALPLTPRLYQVWAQVLRRPDYREAVPWSHLTTFAITDGTGPQRVLAFVPRGREVPLVALPATWELSAAPPPADV